MGLRSRRKGGNGERELVRLARAAGGSMAALRSVQTCGNRRSGSRAERSRLKVSKL